jgi:hypothetical protein
MHKCPKCSAQYGDETKICRTCGAILETVAEEPLQAAEVEPLPAEIVDDLPAAEEDTPSAPPAGNRQGAWTCSRCGQSVPGHFEVCWGCGTDCNGTPDANFNKEPESEESAKPWSPPEEATIVDPPDHACPKCGASRWIPRVRIVDQGQYSDLLVIVHGNPKALIFKESLFGHLRANICGNCGHVELTVDNAPELYDRYSQSCDG